MRRGAVGQDLSGPSETALAEPAVGSAVAGYRIESRIGTGETGSVFRAKEERTGRLAALRVLAPRWAADVEFRLRFIAESRAVGALDDPHILPVYEAGEDGGAVFAAMRLVSGPDAGAIAREEGILPPARALEVLSGAASALDAAHRAGLVHRDVRPENILLDEEQGRPGQAYLANFGLSQRDAAAAASLLGSGEAPGPRPYSSPEQSRGDIVGGRADQYSLACVAFRFLTGRLPYQDDEELSAAVVPPAGPPSLSGLRPELPKAADPVLARAMAATPGARYPTCEEFTEALRGALGLPGRARQPRPASSRPAIAGPVIRAAGRKPAVARPAPPPRVSRSGGRRPAIIASVVIAAAAAIVLPLTLTGSPAPAPGPSGSSSLTGIATLANQGTFSDAEAVAFTPDGRTLIAANVTCDTETWNTTTRRIASVVLDPVGDGILDTGSLSPDGRVMAMASDRNGEISLWNTATRTITATIQVPGSGTHADTDVPAIAFSPDDRTVAVAYATLDSTRTYLFGTGSGTLIRTLASPAGSLGASGVTFSPDGRRIAISATDGDIYLRNAATGALTGTIVDPDAAGINDTGLSAPVFSPDGRSIAAMDGNGTTIVWNVATRRQVMTLEGTLSPDNTASVTPEVAFSPDGRTILTVNDAARLWKAATHRSVATIPGTVTSAAFSPDGDTLAATDYDGPINLWRYAGS